VIDFAVPFISLSTVCKNVGPGLKFAIYLFFLNPKQHGQENFFEFLPKNLPPVWRIFFFEMVKEDLPRFLAFIF
jgi:hypothetical protein